MICKSCNFENKEGAAFCAKCGKPLAAEPAETAEKSVNDNDQKAAVEEEPKTVALDTAQEASKIEESDESEANTTVLTSEMITPEFKNASKPDTSQPLMGGPAPMGAPAPQGGVKPMGGPVPMGAPAPQGGVKPMGGPAPMGAPAPQGGVKPMGGPAPMGAPAPQGEVKPMGGPAPMGAPAPQGGVKPTGGPAPQGGSKPPKAPKQKGAKTGTGTKVYIVISAVLIAALAGVGVWGYLHFNGKLDDAKAEKDELVSQMDESNSAYETQVAEKEDEIDTLEAQLAEVQSQLEECEAELQQYESTSASYAAYDSLIAFAGSARGQGNADFFASDTIIHLGSDQVAVQVYFTADAETWNVIYQVANTGVAVCEWDSEWNGNVATLYVTPKDSGNTIITLSNDINSETIKIYVYVD